MSYLNYTLKLILMMIVLLVEQTVSLPLLFLGLFLIWGSQIDLKWEAVWIIGWGILLAIVWGWSWWLGVLALSVLWLVWSQLELNRFSFLLSLIALFDLLLVAIQQINISRSVIIYLIIGILLLVWVWRKTSVSHSKIRFLK